MEQIEEKRNELRIINEKIEEQRVLLRMNEMIRDDPNLGVLLEQEIKKNNALNLEIEEIK